MLFIYLCIRDSQKTIKFSAQISKIKKTQKRIEIKLKFFPILVTIVVHYDDI